MVKPGSQSWIIGVTLLLLVACGVGSHEEKNSLLVAVAANSLPAMERIVEAYKARTGIEVTLTSGSSGILTRQIREGAPFDAFFSADEGYIRDLATEGFILEGTERVYAIGRLVVVWRAGIEPGGSLEEIAEGRIVKVAIANPDHAPYGHAAQEALERINLWATVQPRLVMGESVGQAFQFVASGNADAGLVPMSLVIHRDLDYIEVDSGLYSPIRQSVGVVRDSPRRDRAIDFIEFTSSPEAANILRDFGYVLPTEEIP